MKRVLRLPRDGSGTRRLAASFALAFALFASVAQAAMYYVGSSGNDSADGTMPETALASVSTAVGKCSTEGGDEVVILQNASPYQITATITLDRAVTVRGETGDPADAVRREGRGPHAD